MKTSGPICAESDRLPAHWRARTALFNWLYARHTGGTFYSRIEDTDVARNTQEAVNVILNGLRWLGLDWDEGPISGDATGPAKESTVPISEPAEENYQRESRHCCLTDWLTNTKEQSIQMTREPITIPDVVVVRCGVN